MDEFKDKMAINIYPEEVGSKTVNEVGTMIKHYFETRIEYEDDLIIFLDNCTSQNKNNYLMRFFSLLTNYCRSIRLLFFLPGHSHMSCDRVFGHISNTLGKHRVFSEDDVEQKLKELSSIDQVIRFQKMNEIREFVQNVADKDIHHISKKYDFLLTREAPTKIFCNKSFIFKIHPKPGDYQSVFNIRAIRKGSFEFNKQGLRPANNNVIKSSQDLYRKGLVPYEYAEHYYCSFSEWGTK